MLIAEVIIHTSIVLYCMYHLNHKLFIIPLIAMPLVGLFAVIMERKLGGIYEEISEENAVLNTIAQENLSGVRTVKAFAKEKFEIKKFLSHNKRYYDLNMSQSKVLTRYQPIFQMITKLLPISIIIYGGYLAIIDEISVGTLAAFVEYSMNITWPLEMIGWLSNAAASAYASNKKIKKIFETTPDIIEAKDVVTLEQVKGGVRFEQVSFALNDTEILHDINFDVPAGKTIGIMGATGSGKTSIINLMQRFYDVNSGRILVDGVDITTLKLSQLRQSIAVVMQDVFLFSESINENVKLGMKEYLEDTSVKDALSMSSASKFIEQMEQGYDTIIGERGVGLSGGQKQRISIARALAKQAPILVLDDSTSALDMETEHQIQQELNKLTDTTKIIIAHRISAVRNADEIIVLEQGSVAERGTHDELLQKQGLYYKTYMAQYGEFLEDAHLKVASCE
jgi:ATP-binding cassette subfamily B protein